MRRMLGFAIVAIALGLGTVGCRDEGPAENAGERLDQALEDAGLREEGALERAGRKLDEAADEARDEAREIKDELERR